MENIDLETARPALRKKSEPQAPVITRRGFLQLIRPKNLEAIQRAPLKLTVKPQRSILNEEHTRKEVVRYGLLGGVGLASAVVAAKNLGINPLDWFDVNRASGGELATSVIPKPIAKTDKQVAGDRDESLEKAVPKNEKLVEKNTPFEKIFGNLSPAEKADAQRRVTEQVDNYLNAYRQDPEGLKKRISDSQKWQPLIDKAAKDLGFKPDSFVPPLLSSLIFVESEGDPDKISYQDGREVAYGLCQLKLDAANEAAKDLGIGQIKKGDLLNPELNIKLSLQTLHRLHQLFPERSLTFWAYHLGETNLARALGSYTESIVNRPKDIDKILNSGERIGTARLINEFKNDENQEVNFIRLVNSQIATGQLKEDVALGDDTQFYVPRIVAAGTLMES